MKRIILLCCAFLMLTGVAFSADSLDIANSAQDEGFQARVEIFLIKAAAAIISEGVEVANHTARVAFAERVLSGSVNIEKYTQAVSTNSTIWSAMLVLDDKNNPMGGAGVTDQDLEFTVNSLIPAFAGY